MLDELDIKLSGKDKIELAIEAGIGAIPVVGGPLQTLYYGSKNEKRFKRIEKFYRDLNEDLECIKNQIPPLDSLPNKDEFLGILEDLNSEVEKAKSQSKITHFKNFYKNTLLTSSAADFDTHSFFLAALIGLTNLELKVLFFYNEQQTEDYIPILKIDGISNDLIRGSINRLTDYGFLSSQINNISNGKINHYYRVNTLGKQFSSFILNY